MQLLDDSGSPIAGSEKELASAEPGRAFFQTAVAWSSNEKRWFVAWTDSMYPTPCPYCAGAVGLAYGTYVTFDGQPSGTVRVLMPCAGLGASSPSKSKRHYID
jgi:hypothetical protein